ncbi:PAS domain S-box protein [Tepidanaerobacter syntrophicus]|uniref:PAS domain S-box protein n=1 Tax=Tepidanaerobacter syntrophicus TaxID=224999 RepID=UPI001BD2D382|nr:PAS domain S-box protein [Tepidanaerobacter syntrophicus]
MRWLTILLYFMSSVFYILLMVFVLRQNPNKRLNRICALAMLPFVIWSTGSILFVGALSKQEALLWLNIPALGWCTFPSFILLFYMEFTGHSKISRRPLFTILCFLPAVLCVYWQWSGNKIFSDVIRDSYGWTQVIANTPQLIFFTAYYVSFISISIYLAYDYWKKANIKRQKEAAKLFFITPFPTIVLGTLTDVIFPTLGITFVPPLAIVFILIWAGGFAYAILKYNFIALTPKGTADEILATMNDVIFLLDSNNNITFVNDAVFRLLNYTPRELQGKPFGFIAASYEDKKEISEELAESGTISNREIYLKGKSGELIPVLISASVVKDQFDEPSGLIISAKDIRQLKLTERNLRESEEKYRNLVEHALIGIGIHQNLILVYANQKFASMLGYSLEEILDKPIEDIIHPEERALILERAERRQKGSNEPETYEMRFLKSDGSYFYALISNVLIEYEGKVATLFNIADITDTKSRIELEQANKELESFSYTVSHDLKAPLRSIIGFSRILLEDYGDILDEKGRDYLERIFSSARRMQELIDGLLKLSKIGRAELYISQVNLSKMCMDILQDLKTLEPARQVETVIAENVTVFGDRNLLRAAMENLLQNAWKFTSKNLRAKIEFGVENSEKGCVYFVRDNGIGFDMAYAEKLFKPFQRLHSESEFSGTGIGLATVQRIIQRHGGKIWVESEENVGTTFYFTLPS